MMGALTIEATGAGAFALLAFAGCIFGAGVFIGWVLNQ